MREREIDIPPSPRRPVSLEADSHAFQKRGHRPLRGLHVSELRSQVGNLLPRCLEIGIGCGSRLGDCQDFGLEPCNELGVRFGPGMKLRELFGVPGPFGLELGLEFGPEPGPLCLDGLERIGLELIVQIQQLAQPSLKHPDFRPGRIKLFPGQVELFVQPAAFIAVCLLGTGKGTVKLVALPTQLFAFLLKFLLAPGQWAAKPLGLGRVCLPQGGQPFQLIELRGQFVVALTELLGKLVPQSLVFLAILFVFRSEAIMVAAELLELDQEGVPLRLDSSVILLEGFQPGAQPLVFLANRRKLAGGLRPLVCRARLGISGLGPFRLTARPVEEIGFRIRVPDLCGYSLDLLDEELVLTLLAPDVLTG